MKKYSYKATCWKECYWKENLWKPGEVYEGDDPPGKYFLAEGEEAPEEDVFDAGSDPRPNVEIKKTLLDKFNFKVPSSWKRRQMWAKLKELEDATARDELTNPATEVFKCKCGFEAKSHAGLTSHKRMCGNS